MNGLAAGGVSWFPQEYAAAFYAIKGVLGLIGAVLLLIHTSQEWAEAMTWGRRLRYLALLFFAVLLASSAPEQIHDQSLVNYRNLGGLVGSLLIIAAAVVSIHETRRRQTPPC